MLKGTCRFWALCGGRLRKMIMRVGHKTPIPQSRLPATRQPSLKMRCMHHRPRDYGDYSNNGPNNELRSSLVHGVSAAWQEVVDDYSMRNPSSILSLARHRWVGDIDMTAMGPFSIEKQSLQLHNTKPMTLAWHESTHNPTYSRGISEPWQTSPDLHNTTHPTYSIHLM